MNIDFDRLKYSLTGEYEEVMLEKQLKEKDKEIERLKNGCKELEQQIDDLYKLETTLTNENERLNNIIKEVKEYIELGMNFDSLGVARTKKKLLQILNKGE